MNFDELGIIAPILKAVHQEGYTTPTPIQAQSIPIALKGGDLLACAQTGTGKTAAFAIPILQLMSNHVSKGFRHIRALILTPTRELAVQIHDSFKAYGKYTSLRAEVIFGGVSQMPQTAALRNGTDILIATPGRLLDLINQGYVSLACIEHFVLDEADRMLDMGFIHDVKKITKLLPTDRQTLFFSATMPKPIEELAQSLLYKPQRVAVTPVSSTAETVSQTVYMVEKKDKMSLLLHLLREKDLNRILVFSRTKHGADKLAKALYKSGIQADAIHGDKTQTARQRALNNFKDGRLQVLVATDIASRGIDVDRLSHVVNFDLPPEPETYVHRIGRTGRAGVEGVAFSFCDAEEFKYLKDIRRLTGQPVPEDVNHPYRMETPVRVHRPAGKNAASPNRVQRPGANNRNRASGYKSKGLAGQKPAVQQHNNA